MTRDGGCTRMAALVFFQIKPYISLSAVSLPATGIEPLRARCRPAADVAAVSPQSRMQFRPIIGIPRRHYTDISGFATVYDLQLARRVRMTVGALISSTLNCRGRRRSTSLPPRSHLAPTSGLQRRAIVQWRPQLHLGHPELNLSYMMCSLQ